MELVSIIVPVYNVEKYLARCIESLVKQSYKNIEILLIDDASTDKSREIIEKYQNIDERVIGIFQDQNKGVSAARNRALDEIHGSWVCFCDSDDWYEKDFVEKMLRCAVEENADYIICNYKIVSDNGSSIVSPCVNHLESGCNKHLVIATGPISSCTHMIQTKLFEDSGVYYPLNCKQYEELPVIPVLVKYSKKIGIVKEALYNYYQRGDGTSASNSTVESDKNFLEVWNIAKDRLGCGYEKELEYHAIYALFYGEILSCCKNKEKTKKIKKKIDKYTNLFPNYYINPYIQQMTRPKKIFLWLVNHQMVFWLRILSWIHSKLIN